MIAKYQHPFMVVTDDIPSVAHSKLFQTMHSDIEMDRKNSSSNISFSINVLHLSNCYATFLSSTYTVTPPLAWSWPGVAASLIFSIWNLPQLRILWIEFYLISIFLCEPVSVSLLTVRFNFQILKHWCF